MPAGMRENEPSDARVAAQPWKITRIPVGASPPHRTWDPGKDIQDGRPSAAEYALHRTQDPGKITRDEQPSAPHQRRGTFGRKVSGIPVATPGTNGLRRGERSSFARGRWAATVG